MYQYLVIGRGKSYFVKNRSKSNNNYKQDEITHIFAQFGGRVFQDDWYSNGYKLCSAIIRFVSTRL